MIDEKTLNVLKQEYAHLLVNFGVGIKKGDIVRVSLTIDDLAFNRLLVEECYKAGAKRVMVHYIDEPIDALHYQYGDTSELKKVYPYQIERYKFYLNAKAVSLHCYSHHYEVFDKLDSNKIADIDKRRREQIFPYYKYSMRSRWSSFAVPSVSWAKKLFPNMPVKTAFNKLWEIIFKCCHVEKNKSIDNWNKHETLLKKRAAYLTSLKIKSLHYSNKLGTNLTIGVIPNSLFIGGRHQPNKTISYNPNFPTEEVFTSPDRLATNGIVYASRPLNLNGKLVKGIALKFKNGRIVEAHAKSNEALLKTAIAFDDGASYLGEAALVPFSSPINQTGLLFYDTLYDENACCHLAFGFSFPVTIPNGNNLPEKELLKKGLNQSKTHIDFMIGTKDLTITALTQDNKKIEIFKNGEWVK